MLSTQCTGNIWPLSFETPCLILNPYCKTVWMLLQKWKFMKMPRKWAKMLKKHASELFQAQKNLMLFVWSLRFVQRWYAGLGHWNACGRRRSCHCIVLYWVWLCPGFLYFDTLILHFEVELRTLMNVLLYMRLWRCAFCNSFIGEFCSPVCVSVSCSESR